jgi:type II secretory pathway pseudopilin PulG
MRILKRAAVSDRVCVVRKGRGFTLVEVMVAAMLLMFAMAGLVPFFLSSLSQSTAVRYKSTATNIAREKMEQIRQLDYREIPVGSDGVAFLQERFGSSEIIRGVTYSVSYSPAPIEAVYGSGMLKEVTVTVGWTGPPKVSVASLTTMIHQQYVGPRVSQMGLHTPDPIEDPLHTPFDCLLKDQQHTLYVYVAEADWGLVINNLNSVGMSAKDTYLRLSLIDDKGTAVQLGDVDEDYKISGMVYIVDPITKKVSQVYFPYAFNSATIPDGYWEFQGVVFNQYEEPGNLWRLRLRVENGGPSAPALFVGIPQPDNESIRLYWSGGDERDRDRYCIQRRGVAGLGWGPWESVNMDVGADVTNILDQGSAAADSDPWGSTATPGAYQYRIWAVDIAGNPGGIAEIEVAIPPTEPVTTTTLDPSITTTTTVAGPTTTTTLASALYTVTVKNTYSNKSFDILIDPEDPSKPNIISYVGKSTSVTISGLPAGNYSIRATASGVQRTASFTLGPSYDPKVPVLTISR